MLLCLITRSKILKSCKSPFHNLLCSILIWKVYHSKRSWIYKAFFTRSKHSCNLRVSISISCPRSLQEIEGEFICLELNFLSSNYRCLCLFFILFYFNFFYFTSFNFLLLSCPYFYFAFFCFILFLFLFLKPSLKT